MLELTKNMETGVGQIDEQHRELIKRINDVVGMGTGSVSKEQTEKTLNFLGDYIIKHFADEEVLQRNSGYPKYEWHKEQHKYYIDEFKKMKKEYDDNGPSAMYTLKLNRSVIEWIVKHIQNVDVELGKYILEHEKH